MATYIYIQQYLKSKYKSFINFPYITIYTNDSIPKHSQCGIITIIIYKKCSYPEESHSA